MMFIHKTNNALGVIEVIVTTDEYKREPTIFFRAVGF